MNENSPFAEGCFYFEVAIGFGAEEITMFWVEIMKFEVEKISDLVGLSIDQEEFILFAL
ncbi:hypothetical protein [Alteribacter aurantiacus]|uniref:hypothetical protein n=1 Tax=Alteribacter aurantiacus TaxID=254410 RepID=UPI0004150F4E|nr:hypothetical protein [Alteribacter aurantiacus]